MATVRAIEKALCQIIQDVVYPNGLNASSIVPYLIGGWNTTNWGLNIFDKGARGKYVTSGNDSGVSVKIVPGFPIQQQLNLDVLAGNAQISVFPLHGSDRNVTRFPRIWQDFSYHPSTLTATVVGNAVTIGGTITLPVSVLINFNKGSYGYMVGSGDTLNLIAANLAALIPGASSLANVITIASVINLDAKIIRNGAALKESKRQIKLFYISVFTPDYDMRELLADAVDNVLGDIVRIDFPEGDEALITYKGLQEFDKFEQNIIYRRDLIYTIEYPTTLEETFYEIGAEELNLTVNQI